MRAVIADSDLHLTKPARLNGAFANSDADVVILLEPGCRIGGNAIEKLIAALEQPGVGLAGPSTNRAWNDQSVFEGARAENVDATAAEAERRFGSQCRKLAPLYSLSDFCYAVKREVFAAIGPADEEYRAGPCWEMDYNVRAARAGFDGVWVCGAYVWRAPRTAEDEAAEAAHFVASKHRYQDKFCGARMRGVKTYREHCRGDACSNFAPREPKAGPPLVSCVMATCNRRAFIPLALAAFRAQTYPHRELIVVDDGEDRIEDLLRDVPDVRYIRINHRISLGAKRNLGCEEARGEMIALWDDDDWYASTRIERQIAPLLRGDADITGLLNRFLLQLPQRKCWTVTGELHRMMYAGDVPGGTIVFHRSIWERGIRFPDCSLAEDAAFLREALSRGLRLARVDHDGALFVYVRHGGNTWNFETGHFLHPSGWRESERPTAFPAESLEAYAAAAAAHAR